MNSLTHHVKHPEKLIDRLFVILTINYGGLFTFRFQNDERIIHAAKREWANDLSAYTPEQIARAVKVMKQQYVDQCPTLPQFVKLCSFEARNGAFAKFKCLSRPKASQQVVTQHVLKLKRMFSL